jgi:hypothetical protein
MWTGSSELRPSWEAASRSAIQELARILWNSKVHCRVHKIQSLVHILNQNRPVHTTPACLYKNHFNINLSPT